MASFRGALKSWKRILLLVADLLIALAFLAGYLARYVHPRDVWWLQLVATFLPWLAALVVLAALGAGLTGRWASLAVHAVLCVLIAVRFFGERGGAVAEGNALVVVTFNANSERTGAGGGEAVRALAEREGAHIVALQEAGLVFLRNRRALGVSPVAQPLLAAGYETQRPAGEGRIHLRLPVLSRLPWESQEQRLLIEPVERTAYTRALVQWQGQEIAVYNVHLRSFGQERPWREGWSQRLSPRVWLEAARSYRADFLARAEEAERLRQVLETETRPFIVAGDFNSTPHHWDYGHLAENLVDAFAAGGRGIGFTYHARLPVVRIDHVLASGHWAVASARVAREPASDHFPVVAALVLRRPS